jgi:hypothetical protein
MTRDEMAAKTEPAKRRSAGAVLEEQLRATLQRASLQQKPVEDLHGSEDVQSLLSRHLDQERSERKAIFNRLQTIEGAIKRRRSRGIVRYLIAIGIGIAATLGWQSYGETTKHIIATKAPELGWSPEAKQMITSWVQQLNRPASPERQPGG